MGDALAVNIRLAEQVNDNETLFDFIRDSEREFGLEQKDVERMTLNQLEEYVNFLDGLWGK